MKVVVITKPDFFEGETDICNRILAEGLGGIHLRKPGASMKLLAKWIEGIEPSMRKRIVVHDFHNLAWEYGLEGIHLNSRNPNIPDWFDRSRFTLSRSCHTIAEVEACQRDFDYVFLSPIFDSISKQGYKAAFPKEELAEMGRKGILNNVYALGGITYDNLKETERLGFAGAAMLGEFWNRQLK